ncbi:MAG: hypothetical protein IJX68_08740 [Rikenellaceae bacterium]|nr:hypothetical protein [Rikenellaceae bacterium]
MNGYTCIAHVGAWTNDHCRHCKLFRQRTCNPRDAKGKCLRHNKRKPIQGDRLALAMKTMESRYGVRFEFCRPADAAQRICELLGVDYD